MTFNFCLVFMMSKCSSWLRLKHRLSLMLGSRPCRLLTDPIARSVDHNSVLVEFRLATAWRGSSEKLKHGARRTRRGSSDFGDRSGNCSFNVLVMIWLWTWRFRWQAPGGSCTRKRSRKLDHASTCMGVAWLEDAWIEIGGEIGHFGSAFLDPFDLCL